MNQTTTMTLTEFLEARLAEDEEVARGLNEERIAQHGEASRPAPWSLYGIAERTLREVEAKRAIVADLRKCEVLRDEHGHATEYSTGELDAYRSAARFLAAVYADHPGYRGDWA